MKGKNDLDWVLERFPEYRELLRNAALKRLEQMAKVLDASLIGEQGLDLIEGRILIDVQEMKGKKKGGRHCFTQRMQRNPHQSTFTDTYQPLFFFLLPPCCMYLYAGVPLTHQGFEKFCRVAVLNHIQNTGHPPQEHEAAHDERGHLIHKYDFNAILNFHFEVEQRSFHNVNVSCCLCFQVSVSSFSNSNVFFFIKGCC